MSRISSSIVAVALALGCSLAQAQASSDVVPAATTPTNYKFTEVNFAGDTFTQLLGINAQGIIAGYHGSGASGHPNKGFTLTLPNTFTAQNFPNSMQTQVIGIDKYNHTVGFYVDSANNTHGFIQVAGQFRTSDFPGTTFNQALGNNNEDESAGYWQDAAGNFHPWVWLLSSNIWESILITGATSAQATGINDAGSVCGFYITAQNVNHGWFISKGVTYKLTYPGATFTQALGVNNLNQVVGTYIDASANQHGFVWTATGGYQSIDDPNGIGTTIVNGINDSGTLVGFWGNVNAGISHGFVAKVTP